MFKRLALSLVLMGLAAFSLGAGAVAYWSDSGEAVVTVTSGSADLTFDIRLNCEATVVDSGDGPFTFDTWQNIAPGDETFDCIDVTNSGDVALTAYIHHSEFPTGTANLAFMQATEWRYNWNFGGAECTYASPDDAKYTTANGGWGCELGAIAPGETRELRVDVRFPHTNDDQNNLEGREFSMKAVVTGYTSD